MTDGIVEMKLKVISRKEDQQRFQVAEQGHLEAFASGSRVGIA